ncbi:MAG: Ig-like domain-containing protein [Verrucomicrobia bacterium]|nr:Ig-like domain-containing protein [Verrucomicrobiota bacterium]
MITSGTPSNVGQNVTFTATIKPQAGTDVPTGSVQFKVDGTNLGDPVAVTTGISPDGTAETSTSTLSVVGSPHAVTAEFTGLIYDLMVGAGGTAGSRTVNGGSGTNSFFDTQIAYGGGGGQGRNTAVVPAAGGSSGGGGTTTDDTPAIAALVLTPMQGFAGGIWHSGTREAAGGGGGAMGVGGTNHDGDVNYGSYPNGRQDGGPGMDLSAVFGTSVGVAGVFAGGGGGGGYDWDGQVGLGGVGGGGKGTGLGGQNTTANSGTANTGGGGGGYIGGAGGSGTVIISYGVTPSTTYDTWASTYANSETAEKDANNDGVANGVAYFMGMNGLATNPGVENGKVTWPHVNALASFMVQISDNLSDWTDIVPPDGSIDETVTGYVTFTLPTGPGITKKFCRLLVVP